MRVLELYSGNKPLTNFFRSMGFDCFSGDLQGFRVSDYPKELNQLDILFIHINNMGLVVEESYEDDIIYGLELLEYYNPKNWIILNNTMGINEHISMWGIPYKDIEFMRGGELIHIRVWNNVFKWEPKPNTIYINPKLLIFELICKIYIKPNLKELSTNPT